VSHPLDSLPLTQLDGTPLSKDQLVGKAVLFVNVASQCGLTPQYRGLQDLYAAQRDQGLVVVGVPCNQFGAQEPGSSDEIAEFCEVNYGVQFPLLDKQEVNGPGRSPLYRWLVGDGPDIQWNFEKFVIGRDGSIVARLSPKVTPNAPELAQVVQKALTA